MPLHAQTVSGYSRVTAVPQTSSIATVQRISPLQDPRWKEFIERHPHASIYHSPGWLEALQRTYGYEPIVLTTAAPGEELQNGIPFCRIQSWLTGKRTVSLPFSDHCQPLISGDDDLLLLLAGLQAEPSTGKDAYFEIRPLTLPSRTQIEFVKSQSFCFHSLDLRPSLPELFQRLHKDCVQRKIQRARREGLRCESGRSESLVRQFYQLHLQTRRRRGAPPQPYTWFRNLIECMGDKLKVWVASKNGRAGASILTLRHRNSLVYKYAAADRLSSRFGGMQLIMWSAIEEAKADGLLEFDLGRSDLHDSGLIDFKDRWGAARSELTYLRSGTASRRPKPMVVLSVAKRISTFAPARLVAAVGRALYRHLG